MVPALLVFAWGRKWSDRPDCNGLTYKQQLDATGEALLASKYWQAKGGRDHLIVSDHYALNYLYEDLKESPSFSLVRRAVLWHMLQQVFVRALLFFVLAQHFCVSP